MNMLMAYGLWLMAYGLSLVVDSCAESLAVVPSPAKRAREFPPTISHKRYAISDPQPPGPAPGTGVLLIPGVGVRGRLSNSVGFVATMAAWCSDGLVLGVRLLK